MLAYPTAAFKLGTVVTMSLFSSIPHIPLTPQTMDAIIAGFTVHEKAACDRE